jgi:hypothetical protein
MEYLNGDEDESDDHKDNHCFELIPLHYFPTDSMVRMPVVGYLSSVLG